MNEVMAMHPSLLWLIAGASLCLFELVMPTAMISLFLGVGALVMSALALILPAWLGLQVTLWIAFSSLTAWLGYRLMPKRSAIDFTNTEAQALTPISPQEMGRVMYEGSSWRAKCGDGVSIIAPQQQVHVIGREGTTLLVVPTYVLEEHKN
jgi:membrane protein implicated in regulation of membrane protease activity